MKSKGIPLVVPDQALFRTTLFRIQHTTSAAVPASLPAVQRTSPAAPAARRAPRAVSVPGTLDAAPSAASARPAAARPAAARPVAIMPLSAAAPTTAPVAHRTSLVAHHGHGMRLNGAPSVVAAALAAARPPGPAATMSVQQPADQPAKRGRSF
jgi:hypothetical protein